LEADAANSHFLSFKQAGGFGHHPSPRFVIRSYLKTGLQFDVTRRAVDARRRRSLPNPY
jgi:hypothetical protein